MTGGRVALYALVAVAAAAWSLPSSAQVDGPGGRPQVCDEPAESITLFANKIGRNRYGYGFAPGRVGIPGPTLELSEGECVAIELVNRADRRAGLHFHGVDYTVASDGTPHNASCVRPGRSRTYVVAAHEPFTRADGTVDPGSAGYWHYHDHCMGTAHGTVGIRAGLFGGLIVRRTGDPVPDHPPVVLVMGDNATINLRKALRTPRPVVDMGDRVEFLVVGHGEDHHTFHLHGHRWTDNRTGLPDALGDATPTIDNRSLGPADSFGFQIVAGEHVGPGAWMYHCHVQGHADAGMAGLLVVRTAGGELTDQTRAAIARFDRVHGHRH